MPQMPVQPSSARETYRDAWIFGVSLPTPTLTTEIGYNYLKTSDDSSARYHQVSVGADYLLSRRADLYAIFGYTHGAGQNGMGDA
jgi:predicted porin